MRKQCTALFLLLPILIQSFSKVVILLDFYANRDYIARTLCENRDKPEMHCHGSCQLHKKIARDEDTDKGVPEKKSETREEILFQHITGDFSIFRFVSSLIRRAPCVSDNRTFDRSLFCFHPPD